ncbi:MAG: hypothetical protein J5I93_08670 [Pirellulaceae bacterium]|nr:hypothetical protein [Pirellulaceae bacterium]
MNDLPTIDDLWRFLPWGFALTVAVETPVLVIGLSRRHSLGRRLFCGMWLTACSYPIVVLVLPPLVWSRFGELPYVVTAELVAVGLEVLLFWLAFGPRGGERMGAVPSALARDLAAIVAANAASFLLGEALTAAGVW